MPSDLLDGFERLEDGLALFSVIKPVTLARGIRDAVVLLFPRVAEDVVRFRIERRLRVGSAGFGGVPHTTDGKRQRQRSVSTEMLRRRRRKRGHGWCAVRQGRRIGARRQLEGHRSPCRRRRRVTSARDNARRDRRVHAVSDVHAAREIGSASPANETKRMTVDVCVDLHSK